MILNFHNIGKYSLDLNAGNDISVKKFEKIINTFLDKGYEFVSIDNYFLYHNNKKILITFDDGYKDQYLASKILDNYGIKGCFFISVDKIGKQWRANNFYINGIYKKDIIKVSKNGHCIASHGFKHSIIHNDFEFQKDIIISKTVLSDLIDEEIKYYSAPFGVIFENNISFLKKNFKKVFLLGRTGIMQSKKHSEFIFNRIPVNDKAGYFKLILKNLLF